MGYQLIDKQTLYNGQKIKLEVHHLEDDESFKRAKREVIVHPGAVVVLPFLDLPSETILLIKNKRYAINQVLLELPAGTLEKGEDPINCAGRELLEETGYLAGRLKPMLNFYSSPGIMSEKMYAFCAYDLEQSNATPEAGEEIELLSASLDDAIRMIRDGRIHDGKTIATLLMYERFFREG
ncbi:MAG TPA: NUDIX hydrolase [Tepidisphaeraceae bacterium]|jgi:ADP-ribose pyrophosphatase